MVAAKVREIYDRAAKDRQKGSGGDKKSATAKSVVTTVPQPISGKSRDKACATVGVGGTTVRYLRGLVGQRQKGAGRSEGGIEKASNEANAKPAA